MDTFNTDALDSWEPSQVLENVADSGNKLGRIAVGRTLQAWGHYSVSVYMRQGSQRRVKLFTHGRCATGWSVETIGDSILTECESMCLHRQDCELAYWRDKLCRLSNTTDTDDYNCTEQPTS